MKNIFICMLVPLFILSACKKKDIDDVEVPIIEASGGLITWSPEFPNGEDALTITFDASRGNGSLKGASGDIYMHAGVITDKSTGSSDWKYVKSNSFNTPDPAVLMTSLGNNLYKITISPRSFFKVPAGEKILKLALLFRNADGSKVARNTDNSDIYLPITQPGALDVRFVNPEFSPTYTPAPTVQVKEMGQDFTISALTSRQANITLYLNGTEIATASNATSISSSTKVQGTGTQTVKVVATSAGSTAESTFTFTVNGTVEVAELPAGAREGVTFINSGRSAIFHLYAPGKQFAYLAGDFNDWKAESAQFMKRSPDGKSWWVQVDNLDPSKEYAYQYWVDGSLRVADPYSEKILDPSNDSYIPPAAYPNLKAYPQGKTTGNVSVIHAGSPKYSWKNTSFQRPETKDLVIYELHLRDFLGTHSYTALKDTLNYLTRLGVNAIELMPVKEFEGNSSWGYNPSFFFASDKYYGTKAALQQLIDECHSEGMAVILDMVLNHAFGQSPMVQLYFDQSSGKPAANSPWFNADPTHPFNVGYDFNHESPDTKRFVKNVMKFWMEEYKVDGFRFDLSKGFTQKNSGTSDAAVNTWSAYDVSRVQIWKDYNNFLKTIDPKFYVILEHFAADAEERELSNEGMMLWNNLNHAYNEGTMGYVNNSDLSRAFYDKHGFEKPYNLVTYMESHDEERLMYKNLQYGGTAGTYNTRDLATALKRQELAAAFFFTIPGPKMIWQFGELGYDKSIEENGRTGEKPILWQYNSDARRKALYNVYSRLIHLKKNNAVFASTDFQYNLTGAVKTITLKSASMNVVVVGNFDLVSKQSSIAFPAGGRWYDHFNGTQTDVPGSSLTLDLSPGEYHIYSSAPLK